MVSREPRIVTNIREQEIKLMKKKPKAKWNFALSKHRLLQLIEDKDLPSRSEVKFACKKMDMNIETSMDVLDKLADFYIENKQIEKGMQIASEMDQLDVEYCSVYEAAYYFTNYRCNDSFNVKFSDPLQRMGKAEVSDSKEKKKPYQRWYHRNWRPELSHLSSKIWGSSWSEFKYLCSVATRGLTRVGKLHFLHV